MTSVAWVYQGNNDNLCWAASIAAVGNYLTGSSYTVADVCYAYPGYIPSDYGMISMFLVCHALQQRYPSISYPSYSDNYVPSGTYMYANLSNNYPMFGCFQFQYGSDIGYHCCVIRGINNNTGKLYIIDPHYGYQAVNKSGGVYSYESQYDNRIYTLIGYGAKL